MVGFQRIKTKWLVTAAIVLAVALPLGLLVGSLDGGSQASSIWQGLPQRARHAEMLPNHSRQRYSCGDQGCQA